MLQASMETEVELKVKVVGSVTPFQRGSRFLSNGDPVYPDEGGYCEDVTVYLTREVKKDGCVKEVTLDITDFVLDVDQLSCDLYENYCEGEAAAYEAAIEYAIEERSNTWDE